ncbi:hypothetical protein PGB28_06525 [Primorskyibacter aestuariivivens]|uniref:COG3904 family protein n=1 Tax=Primorskyibacter aestuariivivens TaxID=1888912 RepID=UPI002300B423|nr:hypothetical protein [Primorskyibacter aestuariivivens]MDA7428105.1 hypothetical protein [Primorskyibacter aestuariivivens]
MKRLLLAALILLPTLSSAMEFRLHGDHPEGCMVTATGPIQPGDADRLRAILPGDAEYSQYVTDTPRLCFDSPGGSFVEGLAIARHLRDTGIAAHVPRDASCLSACAIAFLGGSARNFEDALIDMRDRSLHSTARLGFHAPQLDVPDASFNRAEVQRAFTIAMRSAALTFSRLDELRITRNFALDFFAVEGNAFYEIDTTTRLAQLGAALEGVAALPERLSDDGLRQICAFVSPKVDPARFSAAHNQHQVLNTATYDLPPQPGYTKGSRAFVLGWTVEGFRQWHVCNVRWTGGAEPAVSVEVIAEPFVSDDTGRFDDPTPPTQSEIAGFVINNRGSFFRPSPLLGLPAGTRLRDLQGPHHGVSRLRTDTVTCRPLRHSYRVSGVKNFATLRAAPNFDAPVLREVRRDASVSPGGQGYFTAAPRCISACDVSQRGTLRPADLRRVSACQWSNELWWHMKLPDGTTGWMSAKYLR